MLLGVGYAVGGVIGYAILVIGGVLAGVSVPGYLLAEAGILGLAVIGLAVGVWLVVGVMPRGAGRGASGNRETEPRVR
ncbi:MAG: hypothetical protein M3151_11535 [Actinomycetota bacterium]|nr:hypothetical protein [Actinomycetota bacterium]